ncbi:UNVERIFIED_CONTAM: Retrovirus-related Pol polyprotein from transposon TNT 1-94 [Sesamum latifolium]|uniref:Retrovirus-related Pol polyprotein from transposon TNT 1-94 n=1 Tax=Sesamum latifolium TaxID=2727402 RepID=A0AAW2XCR7_9LAMI
MITTQYQAHIQVLRTDNGGEFVNQDLQRYLNLHGIVHQMTCPYSPQQNGVVERKNRHLLEVVRASLFEANMPTSYWGEAVTVATYLINRMPSSSLQFRTPLMFFIRLHLRNKLNLEHFDVYSLAMACTRKGKLSTNPYKRVTHRVTRGIPRVNYEPLLNSKTKYPINNFVSYHRLSKENEALVNQLSTVSIPSSVQDAVRDPKWKEAMNEEMKSLHKNSTWEIVDLPEGKKPVGCRWVFTIKYKADGTIERYKARLVAKGYTQTYGIDYMETFAPVAKINTAKKGLYGLKQSPRAWFGRFTKSMKSFGYKQSNSDHTLFLKHNKEKVTALIVYVDDMIVTGNDPEERKAREFEMKDLGQLKYSLGIEVSRSQKGIFLSQRKYALDLLNEMGMTACSPASTPMEENLKLSMHPSQVPTNKERYQRLVGRLMYLAHTRPDLAYSKCC